MRYSDTLKTRALAVLMAALLGPGLAACGSSSSGSGSGSDDLASVSLRLTDAPASLASVVMVKFTDVHLRHENGTWERFDIAPDKSIDLYQLRGKTTEELLPEITVPAGKYTEIRLLTSPTLWDNYIELAVGGMRFPLMIPSGSSSGIKIKGDIELNGAIANTMIADFDLLQSITLNGGGIYRMQPVTRLVKLGEVGHISGTVPLSDLENLALCSDGDADTYNAVYVFAGHDAKVEDIDLDPGQGPNEATPVTTTSIEQDSSGNYVYHAAYLPAGDYTIAVTCSANLERLDKDDDNLNFFGIKNVTVMVSNTLFL